MKKQLLTIGLLTLLAAANPSWGRNNAANVDHKAIANLAAAYKTEAGDCRIPVSSFDLSINNVRCKLQNGGDMWWDFDNPKYEVPKGDGTTNGIHAIFAGAIWVSGLDNGGNLKIAAQLFRNGNTDMFAGPLNSSGEVGAATCDRWDRHFVVYGKEIGELQAKAKKGVFPIDVSDNIANWPAKGNKKLKALGFEVDDNLASFWDQDNDGLYDPTMGDYPVIPCSKSDKPSAYGDQMVFWVMNDKGNVHTATGGKPMGIQVNAMSFAFQSTDDVNNMTFYNYQIWNKSGSVFNKTCMTQYADADLGCSDNDRIGCDVDRSLGVVYNGEKNGEKADKGPSCLQGTLGYGAELPILGFDFFEGPKDTSGRQLGMSAFQYFNRQGQGFPQGTEDPSTDVQFRNYQTGRWRDGSFVTYGGNGYGCTATPIPYVYPGDPADATAWSECNPQCGAALVAGDRRILQTASPFTFLNGTKQNITVGVVWVRPNGGIGSNCPNFTSAIGRADDLAQALFDDCFKLIAGPACPTLQVRELDREIILNILNDPASNNFGEKYDQVGRLFAKPGQNGFKFGMDSTYSFEGYKVYQLANEKISATDLNEPVDPSKAVLVAQMDIKNGVSRVVNYEKDPLLGVEIPLLKVEGQDKGIEHSLKVTQDFVNGGALVNHNTYYYASVAYAHNEFLQYNPLAPGAGGQKFTYLQGSDNFRRYTAIPHKSDPRNEGTVLQAGWGSSTEVLRVEGKGNAANNLSLNAETVNSILASPASFIDTLRYSKGFDPIGFRVTDPIQLKEGDFELAVIEDSFFLYQTYSRTLSSSIPPITLTAKYEDELLKGDDPLTASLNHPVDSVDAVKPILRRRAQLRWKLDELNKTTGAILATVPSERYMDRPNEQIIIGEEAGLPKNYGFSLRIGAPVPIDTNKSRFLTSPFPLVYRPISGNIEFADSRNPWLSFVKDAGLQDGTNWIRSGDYTAVANNPDALIFDANFYILYREGNDGNFYAVNPSTGLEQIDFQNGLITNAQVGDAFSDFPSHNDDTCNVSSINIISTIIGLNLKQLIGVFDTSTGIAEGIGEVGPTCLPTLDGGGGLSCYNKQGQTIQFSNIDCSLFPMPLRQNLNTPQLHNINVQVYPNPTTTSIYFDNTNANYTTVAVYNIIGQEMQQQELNFSNKEQINFANFETGIYFLKFNNNKNNNTIVKVVKE